MKLIIILAMWATSAAFACGNDGKSEAQFFGHYTNINYSQWTGDQSEHYTYKIEIDEARTIANPFCPLDLSAEQDYFWYGEGKPEIREGQEISGVLVYDLKTQMYHIE